MNIFKRQEYEPFLWFIYSAVVVTLLSGILYVSIQQSFRQNLNDPQIQIVEDIVHRLKQGSALQDQVPPQKVAIDTSLTWFVVLYDTEGNPIVGNGYIGDKLPVVPKGVFDMAKSWGENRRTLEPARGVRIASVIQPFVAQEANGYVLVGRNMREVESRIGEMGLKIFVAWVVVIGTLFILSCILWWLRRD
jgi:sensor histidine kinase regulating citrate/malate metabolism